MEYDFLACEKLNDGAVARITLMRPEVRNALNRGLLCELDDALLSAEADDAVRVVILRGAGAMFSSGHDMGSKQARLESTPGDHQHPSMKAHGGTAEGAERRVRQEWHYFFQNTLRWRNLRKITIAQVHGPVYAGALMLAWCCDLIVAAAGTTFADIVATRMGICGAEYFAHPWEFGPRRAKELLLTGDQLDADEAYKLGMVSKVFPIDELDARTLEFASRIARQPTMTALLIKESVNQSMDIMGFTNALNACYSIHQLNHAHWAQINENKLAIATAEHGIADSGSRPAVKTRRHDAAD